MRLRSWPLELTCSWPGPPFSPAQTMPPPLPRYVRQGSRLPRIDRPWVAISSIIDSLHPLEIKVLTAFGTNASGSTLETDQLASTTSLEPSQLSMAIEWLLAKSLLVIDKETVTPVVSLTPVGEQYHATQSPIEEVLAAARDSAGSGQRLTIQDLQSREGLDPSDVSKRSEERRVGKECRSR